MKENFVSGDVITSSWLNEVGSKLNDSISVKDLEFGAKGDGITDDTAALQAAIASAEASSAGAGKKLLIPAGVYKITSPLIVTKEFITIEGDGMWATKIIFDGVSSGITTSAMQYIRPHFSNFSIVGASSSGIALNFGNITAVPRGECYGGVLRNLYLETGGKCLYAPFFFSMMVDTLWGSSKNDHTFVAACGPGCTWQNCYAVETGIGKAGYRLRGIINLENCNGVNSADWWGIFGEDKSATDGYQNDFPTRVDSDSPSIRLESCNLEEYASKSSNGGGILVHSIWRYIELTNCKFDRNNLSTPYKAIIQIKKPSNSVGQYALLGTNAVFPGTGTPSLAKIYANEGGAFYDANGDFSGVGITSYYDALVGIYYPLLTTKATPDVFGDSAYQYSALTARRFTTQVARYDTKTVAPVGTNQTIDVTGKTKVFISPAAAATIRAATFSKVPGSGDDYGRNGELVLEATNGNTTIVHSASGGDTFRTSSGSNIVMTTGQVIKFQWSETSSSWWQV